MLILIWSTAALLFGFLLDIVFGDPHNLPHIVRLMGNLITKLEKLLRNLLQKTQRGELAGGILLVCSVTLLCAGIPFIMLYFSYRFHPLLGFIIESFICYQLLAAKSLETESMNVYYSLSVGNTESARNYISKIVGRDTAALDNDGIARAAVETVSENTSDGVVAPLLHIMIGGATLGCLYKAVNTMDSMVGYKNDKYLYFGRAAARTDDVLNYIPSRICALLMIISADLVGLSGRKAFRVWRRDRDKHASPNSAQTEAVCAGALGIRLAGPASYDGVLVDKQYIGDERRPIRARDIKSANRLMYATSVLALILALMVRVGLGMVFYATI